MSQETMVSVSTGLKTSDFTLLKNIVEFGNFNHVTSMCTSMSKIEYVVEKRIL